MPKKRNAAHHEANRTPFLAETESTNDQEDTEIECRPYFVNLDELKESDADHLRRVGLMSLEDRQICLLHQKHYEYLSKAFGALPGAFVSLDASRPWMLYWTLHGCDLVGQLPPEETLSGIVDTLKSCWQQISSDSGGFGGGPGQMAHCAPTYASVLSLCIIATSSGSPQVSQKALDYLAAIRLPLRNWFVQLKEPHGGFRVHFDGEVDVRATYIIICCAKLLNVVLEELCDGLVSDYIRQCQTFEGGFGGEPGSEAHGGYTFCAVAALQLLNSMDSIDLPELRGWLVRRQMAYEGGFQGRCNKLVDGCYSFWQGGALAILSAVYSDTPQPADPWLDSPNTERDLLFTEAMLQRYILLCAQDVTGGLRDKPSKSCDFYHSCYNLSGLSVSQHYGSLSYGHPSSSLVAKTHPCYNIRVDRAETILKHFTAKN